MLLRRLARPLFSLAFVTEGLDAARNPEPHAVRVEDAWRRLGERTELPALPPRDDLVILARAHGAATAAAGLMLATGRAPRVAALALALLTLPRALVEEPFSGEGDQQRTRRFLTTLSMVGGALIAAADTAGRPGMTWRVQHARVGRDLAKDARIAVLEARREARHAVEAARKEAKEAARQLRRAA